MCQEFFLLRDCKLKKKLAISKTCDTLKKIKIKNKIITKSETKKSCFICVIFFEILKIFLKLKKIKKWKLILKKLLKI